MVTLGRRCHANRDHHRGTSDTLSGRHEGCERRTALATLNRNEGCERRTELATLNRHEG
jgi:hypothetical protein